MPAGVTEGGDFSSSIIDLMIVRKESHWTVSGIARVSGRTGKTFLFLGSQELAHGDRIVPIAMPDLENRFSFRVDGALVGRWTEVEGLTLTGGLSFPSFLYVGAFGHPVRRIDLAKINSKQEPANKTQQGKPR